jgi:hypothetical protein
MPFGIFFAFLSGLLIVVLFIHDKNGRKDDIKRELNNANDERHYRTVEES